MDPVPDLFYQISSKKMLMWEGKKTVLLSTGCLTSFLVRCMCPLPSLRQNDLTVAEIEFFATLLGDLAACHRMRKALLPNVGEARPQRAR